MPSRDSSIHNEPHLRRGGWQADPSEQRAERNVDQDLNKENLDDQVHQSVWNEPGAERLFGGKRPPENALTYENWLRMRISQTGILDSWAMVFCWAVIAGPLAILGVLIGSANAFSFLLPLNVIVIGPVAEELMKIAIPLWVVERRPYFFKSRVQIFVCALVSGVVFAAVENVMYLTDSVFDWENPLTRWRWTICVALHTFCCLISALGISRIWRQTMTDKTPPVIQLGVPYITLAIILHGSYNAFALAFEWIYHPF